MKFRPCIDIHNGKVKQIVGSSLRDEDDAAVDNFVSDKQADYYASMYRRYGLAGGHIIILNPAGSDYYEADVEQARLALEAFPGGMQIGGGINDSNASSFIEMGASHVIVTSFVFHDGKIDFERLKSLVSAVGKEHIVLDLSCRRRENDYYIVTDRWQKFTQEIVSPELFEMLSDYCGEFLVHAVDVEGKAGGVDEDLARLLCKCAPAECAPSECASSECAPAECAPDLKITYAGGVRNLDDIDILAKAGNGCLDVTIGSALDIFGGSLRFEDVVEYFNESTSY